MRYPTLAANGGGIRYKLALVTTLIAMAVLPAVSQAQDSAGGSITTGDPDADAIIADIERVTADLVEVKEQLRSDRLDPDVVLDTIGADPDGILEWVASETRWLPYEGALRGPRGVLMDRSGSSLDRALLLADLLGRAGLEVRLANTTLPADVAASLAATALEGAPVSDAEPMFASAEEIEGYRTSVASAAAELASDIDLLAGSDAVGGDAVDVIADHWWVQASSEGQWTDYDPLFPAGAEARPAAEITVDPAALPEDLRHTATIRVVIERSEDGALVEEIPLEHTVLMGTEEPVESIELDFSVAVPPELTDTARETVDLREGARLAAFWRPRLRVQGQTVRGEWFSEAGRLEPPTVLAAAGALSEGLDALGGIGAEPVAQEPGDTSLSATWIEYETAGPGIAPRTERRQILDLIGASRDGLGATDDQALAGDEADLRRGLAFLGDTSILLQGATTHPDAVLDAYLDTWIELRPALIALAFLGAGVEDERIGPSLASPQTRPVDLLAMTSVRDQWATSRAGFIGRPQLWSEHVFFDAQDEANASRQAVDIVMNDTAVMPGAGADPRLVRLEQGLLDTLIEHALDATPDGLNTWERFARRGAEGVDWAVLRPGSDVDAGLADALPAADLARIRTTLERGDTVVVATEPRLRGSVPFADWWRISEDGTALGMGYRGWGQDTTEEGDITVEISLESLKPLLDADKTAHTLRTMEATARRARLAGAINPYAHLSVFADTLPIIVALARTLPFIKGL